MVEFCHCFIKEKIIITDAHACASVLRFVICRLVDAFVYRKTEMRFCVPEMEMGAKFTVTYYAI